MQCEKYRNLLQCSKSRDDNFPSNYFISKGQFQTHFSQLQIYSIFLNSYGGQYMSSIAPNKSGKIHNQLVAEKSGSEKMPSLSRKSKPIKSYLWELPTLNNVFEPKEMTQKSQKCKYLKIGKIAKKAKIPQMHKI